MLPVTVQRSDAAGNSPPGCPCDNRACTMPSGHWWTREEVAALLRIRPRTVADYAREHLSCPVYGVGHGRGSKSVRYTWAEVQAFVRWLETRGTSGAGRWHGVEAGVGVRGARGPFAKGS